MAKNTKKVPAQKPDPKKDEVSEAEAKAEAERIEQEKKDEEEARLKDEKDQADKKKRKEENYDKQVKKEEKVEVKRQKKIEADRQKKADKILEIRSRPHSRTWSALRACADVDIVECGGLKLKRNQCIASSEPIYRVLANNYRELKITDDLIKGGDKESDCILKEKVYEIYQYEE